MERVAPPEFLCWGDMLPEMQGEVATRCDPLTRLRLAACSKSSARRFRPSPPPDCYTLVYWNLLYQSDYKAMEYARAYIKKAGINLGDHHRHHMLSVGIALMSKQRPQLYGKIEHLCINWYSFAYACRMNAPPYILDLFLDERNFYPSFTGDQRSFISAKDLKNGISTAIEQEHGTVLAWISNHIREINVTPEEADDLQNVARSTLFQWWTPVNKDLVMPVFNILVTLCGPGHFFNEIVSRLIRRVIVATEWTLVDWQWETVRETIKNETPWSPIAWDESWIPLLCSLEDVEDRTVKAQWIAKRFTFRDGPHYSAMGYYCREDCLAFLQEHFHFRWSGFRLEHLPPHLHVNPQPALSIYTWFERHGVVVDADTLKSALGQGYYHLAEWCLKCRTPLVGWTPYGQANGFIAWYREKFPQ